MKTMPSTTPDLAAALLELNALDPGHSSRLRSRIGSINAELAARLEQTRLGTTELRDYIRQCARLLNLRNVLSHRLEQAVTGSASERLPLPDEVSKRVMAVARFRTGDQLRMERARIISGARVDLAETDAKIAALRQTYNAAAVFSIDKTSPRFQAGLSGGDDEFLFRTEALLSRRRNLLSRLQALDPLGDEGRAQLVASAIEAAGGDGTVAAAIASPIQTPSMAKLVADRIRHSTLIASARKLDPETELVKQLVAQADELEDGLEQTAEAVRREQLGNAGAIVAAARTGAFEGILELERRLSGGILPELATALRFSRGEEGDWPAVVDELVKGREDGDESGH